MNSGRQAGSQRCDYHPPLRPPCPHRRPAAGINVYDLRKECAGPLCYDFSLMERYLAQPAVRKALGVGDRTWEACSESVHADMMGESKPRSPAFPTPEPACVAATHPPPCCQLPCWCGGGGAACGAPGVCCSRVPAVGPRLRAADWGHSFDGVLPEMLAAGVKVLIYAGDKDIICNFLGNRCAAPRLGRSSCAPPPLFRGVLLTHALGSRCGLCLP